MKFVKKAALHALLCNNASDGAESLKSRILRVENLENRELLSASTLGDVALVDNLTSNAAIVATESQDVAPIDLSNAVANTIVVNSSADSGDGSLRAAIAAANDGDTITFDLPATTGEIVLSSAITINKDITIDASSATTPVVVSGNSRTNVFVVDGATVTLNSVTIKGGAMSTGQLYTGLWAQNGADVTLENCVVSNNSSQNGAIGVTASTLTLSHSFVTNNTGLNAGGAIYAGDSSTVNVVASTISNNTAASGSGVYAHRSTVNLTNSLVADNTDNRLYKGVFYLTEGGVVNSYNSTIANNSAGVYSDYAGAVNLYNSILLNKGAEKNGNSVVLNAYNTLSANTVWSASSNVVVYNANQPLFKSGSYELTDDSQAIDKGSASYVTTETDFFGNERINHWYPDLGYYEAQLAEDPSLVVTTLDDVVDNMDYEISLREAIAYAAANPNLGAEITFQNGLTGTITLNSGELEIAQSLKINGENITIDANNASRAIKITGSAAQSVSVELSGFSFVNGNAYGSANAPTFNPGDAYVEAYDAYDAYDGGAISVSNATLTISDAVFENNAGYVGGAIFVSDGSLNLTDVEFIENVGHYQGGAVNIYASSDKTVQNPTSSDWENVTFSGNHSDRASAAYFRAGVLNVSDSSVVENDTTWANGSFVVVNTSATITNVDFNENAAVRFGGALFTSASEVSVNGGSFTGNVASYGGAVYSSAGSAVTYSGVDFTDNVATSFGGAIYGGKGTTTISDSTFTNNVVGTDQSQEGEIGHGGAIYVVNETLNVSGTTTFTRNSATNSGGAIFVSTSAIATIADASFVENTADEGGALRFARKSSGAISGATFTGNRAVLTTGGAIHAGETTLLTIDASTFAGNESVSSGGAIYAAQTTTEVKGSTFQNNLSSAKYGGAIFSTNGALTVDDASSFNTNSAVSGGAITVTADKADKIVAEIGGEFTSNVSKSSVGFGKGGAIYSQHVDLVVSNASFTENTSYSGGAIVVNGAGITATDVDFIGNSASGQAGAVAVYGLEVAESESGEDDSASVASSKVSTFTNVTFKENTAARAGALYFSNAALKVNDSEFTSNTASLSSAGAATVVGGSADFVRTNFSQNHSGRFGGALNLSGTTVTITGASDARAEFASNESQNGGAIYASKSNLTIEDVNFSQNAATNIVGKGSFDKNGGALTMTRGALSIASATFSENTAAKSGGAIFVSQTDSLRIESTLFNLNSADVNAGAIYSQDNDLALDSVQFSYNSTQGYGGALLAAKGTLTATGSQFVNNTTTSRGGAIYTSNVSSKISATEFNGNSSEAYGGALYLYGDFSSSIDNSLLVSNSALYGSVLVANGSAATVDLENVTVADNVSAKSQDFRLMAGATVNAYNSILVGDSFGAVANGAFNAYNTLSPFTGWTESAANPEYDSEASLFTEFDYELVEGSQAIDMGDDSYVTSDVDFAGNARKVGTVDLGAYEFQASSDAVLDEAFAEYFDDSEF